jgi:hypothetical protein
LSCAGIKLTTIVMIDTYCTCTGIYVDVTTVQDKILQYSQRHSVINHCDRRITLLNDTDISFVLFNLFTYFLVHHYSCEFDSCT